MTNGKNDIGMIGLAVMGRNLVLNMADRGFSVAAYNRTESVTREFVADLQPGQRVQACYSIEEFLDSLDKPRKIMMMVKAGRAVDAVIAELSPLLDPGDVLIDGGNSRFQDTESRQKDLGEKGIYFLGVGISGGESGARNGPSMMPGGKADAYELVRPIFEAIAARAEGEPCVAYMGPGGAGHYVKMVHNGIEYGLMQLLAETYALLKLGVGLDNEALAATFDGWNKAELESYLVEITADIFRRRDDQTEGYLVDLIRGEAGQLGTGMWTSQSALDLGVAVPNIDVAVAARNISALGEERRALVRGLAAADTDAGLTEAEGAPSLRTPTGDRAAMVESVRAALFAAMIITYAQGFAQLRVASRTKEFDLKLERVAAVWRGGCIIRARLLRDIMAAFVSQPDLSSLLLDATLARAVAQRRAGLSRVAIMGASEGIPLPALMTALAYLDSNRSPWLPANLIQAQRDYFGAHTYLRTDREGVFHTDWAAE